MANFKSFIANDAEWDEANREVVDDAGKYSQDRYPAMDELEEVVTHEVRYQKAIWSSDYERALTEARAVTAGLKATELRGYRALWHYLAGSASQSLSAQPGDSAERVAREQFLAAKGAAPSVPWLAPLARGVAANENGKSEGVSVDVNVQVERLEGVLLALGTASNHQFEKRAKPSTNTDSSFGSPIFTEPRVRMASAIMGVTVSLVSSSEICMQSHPLPTGETALRVASYAHGWDSSS